MQRTPWIHELRWPEIEAYLASDDVVLIPIGATEQHGRHLPLLVDTGWAMAACEGAARAAEVLVAPPLHFGWSPHHMGYPGTVTLGADTLRRVTLDVCNSLIHHGFKRLILVNGNRIANLQPLEIAAVELVNRTGAYVAVADAGLIARKEIATLCEAPDGGLEHAAEAETSFALHWAPDHVELSAASAPEFEGGPAASRFDYPVELDPAKTGNAVSRFVSAAAHRAATAPDGLGGDPTLATREKGEAMVAALVANLVALIEEVRDLEVGPVRADPPV